MVPFAVIARIHNVVRLHRLLFITVYVFMPINTKLIQLLEYPVT